MESRAAVELMFRRLLADLVRWFLDRWTSGEIDKARKKEEWDDQRDTFKDASDRWRRK